MQWRLEDQMVLLMSHKTFDDAHNIAQVYFIFIFTFNITIFSVGFKNKFGVKWAQFIHM